MNAKDFIKELEKHTSLTYEDVTEEPYVVERMLKTITRLMVELEDLKLSAKNYSDALYKAVEAVDKNTPIQKVDGDITNSTITGILLLTGEGHTVSENLVKGLVTTYNPKAEL